MKTQIKPVLWGAGTGAVATGYLIFLLFLGMLEPSGPLLFVLFPGGAIALSYGWHSPFVIIPGILVNTLICAYLGRLAALWLSRIRLSRPSSSAVLLTLLILLNLLSLTVGGIIRFEGLRWEAQANAYAELAGKLEATQNFRPDRAASSHPEPEFPDYRIALPRSARQATTTREYQFAMYDAHLRYLLGNAKRDNTP